MSTIRTNAPSDRRVVDSPMWVEAITPFTAPYWSCISHVFKGLPFEEIKPYIDILKLKRRVIIKADAVDLELNYIPMPASDHQRLMRLVGFEQGGFQLTSFRHDTALFSREGREYVSMNELAERGFLPKGTITVSPENVAITTFHGQVIDVFVPIESISDHFEINRGLLS